MKVTKQPTTKTTPTELVALVDTLRGQVAELENTLQSSDGTRELLENIQDGILVIDAATHTHPRGQPHGGHHVRRAAPARSRATSASSSSVLPSAAPARSPTWGSPSNTPSARW